MSGPSRMLSCRLLALTILPYFFGSLALAQDARRDSPRPPACSAYDSVQIPASDLPTAQDRQALASCNSADLYFGFGNPADPESARKCAFIEREHGKGFPETVFGAAGLLTMIYANGKGATRNFDLALKFSCEVVWARNENYGRFEHLLRLKKENWKGDNFNLCDDATSGFMMGQCAALQEHFDREARACKIDQIIENWDPGEKSAFLELQQAAKAFFEASSQHEVDHSGTGRVAFEIEAEASLNNDFVAALEKFARGQLPEFSTAEASEADAELDSIYSKIQAEEPNPFPGTVTPQGIRIAEEAWLRYREAWVQFGRIKYPNVTADSWRTWLTHDRIKMLQKPR